ncbi:MAG: universal stress protein [Thermodesulfobacteriota bacterium]
MFTKLLLCVDPYPPGDALVSRAIAMRELGAREVVLAHVLADAPHALDATLREQARPELERQQRLLEEAGFQTSIHMAAGHPAHALNALAEQENVSVILIGAHGGGLLESIALAASPLGNVSAKLLHQSRRPVLLVPTAPPAGEKGGATGELFSRILFPTDFSDTAEIAFAYLDGLLRARPCPVTLLHVQERARPAPHLGHRLQELQDLDEFRLRRLQLWLTSLGVPEARIDLSQGEPGEEVVARAKAGCCSLILMGTQGKGITREILLGSVAHQVARHTGVPVLFIPALQ